MRQTYGVGGFHEASDAGFHFAQDGGADGPEVGKMCSQNDVGHTNHIVFLRNCGKNGKELFLKMPQFICRISALLHGWRMQATISVSGRGLIALPAEMRRIAGIRPQNSLIAETTAEGILLRPAVTLPVELYTMARIAEFDAVEVELASALA